MRPTTRPAPRPFAVLATAAALALSAASPTSARQEPATQPADEIRREVRVIVQDAREAAERARESTANARADVAGQPAWTRQFLLDPAVQGWNAQAAQKTEKAAFLGVGVAEPVAALSSQLDLPRGIGLAVVYVEEGAPAAKAGLQEHDVLHKLDEQILVNPAQFATLVRTYKPGAEVTLTVIRKGKPQPLKATLVERELPVLSSAQDVLRINDMAMPMDWASAFAAVPLAPSLPSPRVTITGPRVDLSNAAPRVIRIAPGGTSKIVRSDDAHTIQLDIADGRRTLVLKDASGKELYNGPLNDDADRAKLAAPLREKVRQLEQGIELVPPTTAPAPKAEVELEQSASRAT